MRKPSDYTKFVKTSVCLSLATCAFITLALYLFAHEGIFSARAEDDGDIPRITSFNIAPKKLTRNRINNVTLEFGFTDRGANLLGGMININISFDGQNNRFYAFPLSDKVFMRKKGTGEITFPLLVEGWDKMTVMIWVRDAEGNIGIDEPTRTVKARKKSPKNEQGNELGKKAYDFTLKDKKGNDVTLYDYKGKVIMLDLCTMWCSPCKEEAAALAGLYKKYKKQGFVILSLIFQNYLSKPPTRRDLKSWTRTYKIKTPVLADLLAGVYEAYTGKIQSKEIPHNFLIDRNLKVSYDKLGYTAQLHADLEAKIEELLAQ